MANQSINTSAVLGWQLGLTKDIKIKDFLTFEITGGYTTSGSKYQIENRFPDTDYYDEGKRINLSYGFLETGFKLNKTISSWRLFTGAAFRGGLLVKEKVNDIFYRSTILYHENFDYGVNFKAGLGYELSKIKPFLQVAYYSGLANITSQSYMSGQPPQKFSNEMVNRGLSIQAGFRF